MATRTPRVPEMLSKADVQQMHDGALKILAEVGLEVEGEELVTRLTLHDGVALRNDRVCLAPWLVEQHVAEYRAHNLARERPEPRQRIHLSAGCCAHHIPDTRTGKVRPITTEDLIRATKLIDALHGEDVTGHAPGFPQDVPPPLLALAEYRIGSQYTRWGGSSTAPSTIEGLEYIYEMHQVMGQGLHLSLYVVNPLRIVGDSLQAILHFTDRAAGFSSGSMPLMGGTAPIHFVGAFVQAMAEELGGFVVLRLLAPGKPVSFGVMAFCLDMKYGGITYGSPEQNLCDLIRIPVNAFYGMENVSTRSIRSMAKRPGIQAAAEKAASAVAGALAGSRSFMGAGTLSVDEVFSPEQLIIDREIADYAGRIAQGFEYDAEKLSLDIIAECAERGEYLLHPSTLAYHRKTYWTPRLFEHMSLSRWQQLGEPELIREAEHMVEQCLSTYDFELPAEKCRELDIIYERATRALGGL